LGGWFDIVSKPNGNPGANLFNSAGGRPDRGSDAFRDTDTFGDPDSDTDPDTDPIHADCLWCLFQPGGILADQGQLALGGCE
jgi:hypothetical protein